MKSRTTAALTTTLLLAACGSGGSDNQDNSMTDTENNCSNTPERPKRLSVALLASFLTLSACDPRFESTSDACRLVGDNSSATLPRKLFTETEAIPEADRVAAFDNDVDRNPTLDGNGNPLYWLRARNDNGELLLDSKGNQLFEADYSADASTNENEYKLYFQDYFNALPETDTIANSDAANRVHALAVLDDIQNLLNDTFALGYTIENGQTVKSQNALDFLSSRESTADDNLLVGTFEIGRGRVADAIEEDTPCAYRDTGLTIEQDPFNPNLDAIYEIFFNPFAGASWVQSFISTDNPKDNEEVVNLLGSYFTDEAEFQARGYAAPSIVRTGQSIYRDPTESQAEYSVTMNLIDRYAGDSDELQEYSALSPEEADSLSDSQVISLTLSTQNGLCLSRDTDGDPIVDDNNLFVVEQCTEGTTRTPRRPECLREATEEELGDSLNFRDETGVNKEFWITLGGQDYKRVRVDIDFKYDPDQDGNTETQVRVFASTFFNAIENGNILLDAGGNLVAETDSDGNTLTDPSGNTIYVSRLTAEDVLTEARDADNEIRRTQDGRTIYLYRETTELFPDVIKDPSSCEQTAVEEAIQRRIEQFSLSSDFFARVADPAYDRDLTIEGEVVEFDPTPLYEYVGTPVSGRNLDNN